MPFQDLYPRTVWARIFMWIRSFGSIIGPVNLGFELEVAMELSMFAHPQQQVG